MTDLILSGSVCVLSLCIAYQAWYFRNFSAVLMKLIEELQRLKAEDERKSIPKPRSAPPNTSTGRRW